MSNGPNEKPLRVKKLERDAAGKLVLCLEGEDAPREDVRLARCFPWSIPDTYISIRDSKGKEIVLLNSLEDLDEESRRVAEAELREKVFNPKVLRVIELALEFGVFRARVVTDRGEVTFQFRGRDDVRLLGPTRALFRDSDGNTYEVADYWQLDPASRKRLAPFF